MRHREIDNRGLQCPQPVLNTKKALEELLEQGSGEFLLTVIVDNEAANENVARFATTAGCKANTEKKGEDFYIVIHRSAEAEGPKPQGQPPEAQEAERCHSAGEAPAGERIFLFKSSTLGEGNEELGKILMGSFIYTLKETGSLPAKMLFLNSGVYLTTEGSPVLEDLQELEKMGVEILSCGTCLDYYQLKEKLQVGKTTNMYDTVESIFAAARCITL